MVQRTRRVGGRFRSARSLTTIHLYVVLATLLTVTRERAISRFREARHDDTGSVTLEQVVIGLGLLILAIAAVAGITAAVNSRLTQIN